MEAKEDIKTLIKENKAVETKVGKDFDDAVEQIASYSDICDSSYD
jgi:hypothetical protein